MIIGFFSIAVYFLELMIKYLQILAACSNVD